MEIYQKLLAHTRAVLREINADVFVFLTKENEDDYWQEFHQEIQVEGDLGMKMSFAFQGVFAKGYEQILIVGSDCPGITAAILEEGFPEIK